MSTNEGLYDHFDARQYQRLYQEERAENDQLRLYVLHLSKALEEARERIRELKREKS